MEKQRKEDAYEKQKIVVSGLCLVSVLTVGVISVNADVKDGTSWQTAEYVNIPPHGGTKYNLSQGNY